MLRSEVGLMPRIPRPLIAALGAAVIVLVAGFWVARGPYPEARTIGEGVGTFQELSDRFQALAEKKGGAYAYEVLKRAVLPPNTDLHLLGHAVGDILYRQKGVDAIEICTQDFRNACSHSIVIGTLNEFGAGDATIQKIRDACHKAPGGTGAYTMCFHGLGHGVFAYFGYNIPKAVAFCKRLGTDGYHDEEYGQCVGGIIMELIDGGGHDHDKWEVAHDSYLNAKDPLAPCDTSMIPGSVKNFCYMYLTPHLFEAAGANLAMPEPPTFPQAFSYCDAIGDTHLRSVCYGSFGKEFVPLAGARDIRRVDQMTDDEYRVAISWCMLAPRAEGQGACMGQAVASVFWGGENDPDASFRFCGLVPEGTAQRSCYSELENDIVQYVTDTTKRAALCKKLPADNATACEQGIVHEDAS